MIEIKCDCCGAELKEPGGLAFSPPAEGSWFVMKYHFCIRCWENVLGLLSANRI